MYLYDDEDNAPMSDDVFDRIDVNGHNPTVYGSFAEMKAVEKGETEKKVKPDNGCWNCINYDPSRGACTINWNNMDESYYNPDTDDMKPTDICKDHDIDPDADPEDWDDLWRD